MDRKKRAFDLVVTVAGLTACVPVTIAVGVAMRATGDPGPIFFGARRIGAGGHPFTLVKFRTMYVNSSGGMLTSDRDPRVTPLGRHLRRWKIDEIPQLWNVLRGEMSLVGPRPEDPRFVDLSDPTHRRVFTATPGITGLAQLKFRNEEALLTGSEPERVYREEILPEKLRLDALYLDRRSLRLDARILLATALSVLRRSRPRQR